MYYMYVYENLKIIQLKCPRIVFIINFLQFIKIIIFFV